MSNYHMKLKYAIGLDEFMSDIDGMYAFINKEVPLQEEEGFWEEPYQGLIDSPNIDYIMDQENLKRMLTPMISLSELRYVSLISEEKNDGQVHKECEGKVG